MMPIVCTLMALDPNFMFAWRTQYYLQLMPAIFLFTRIGLLGKHYSYAQAGKKAVSFLWWGGVLFGFAAYCYFIYAIYAAIIAIIYSLTMRRNVPLLTSFVPLAACIFTGWLPFLYAHVSIILNMGIDGYVQLIHQLLGAYNIVDHEQGGVFFRLQIVCERIANLFGGTFMETFIMGNTHVPGFLKIGYAVLLLTLALSSASGLWLPTYGRTLF